jgi:cytoskeleton protein RodZ
MSRRSRRPDPTQALKARSQPKPWEEGDGAGGSFGSWLRQQREIRNLTLREISDATRIGMRYLAALEDDRFEVLPAPVFAKGFLREYARYVGLDPDEVVNFYLAAEQQRRGEQPEEAEEERSTAPMPMGDLPSLRPLVPWLLGLLAVAALVAWLVTRRGDGDRAEAPPTSAPPVAATPAPRPAPPGGEVQPEEPDVPLHVTLGFTGECWVEAVLDGERRISELRVQGESMQLEAEESVVLTLGNGSVVRVEVNGEPFDLGAGPGQVVRDLLIQAPTAPGNEAGTAGSAGDAGVVE